MGRLGAVPQITPKVVENLYAADLGGQLYRVTAVAR